MKRSLVAGWFAALLMLLAVAPQLSQVSARENWATPASEMGKYSLYFLRDGKLAVAHREIGTPVSDDDVQLAVSALLDGPTEDEGAAGLSTALSDATTIGGGELAEKTYWINLSSEILNDEGVIDAASAAQIVFTLTQYPEVENVALMIDQEPAPVVGSDDEPLTGPLTREDFEPLLPLVFVESTAPGDVISSPVTLSGSANTFEATFIVEILDAGEALLTQQVVTATSGNGFRGTFEVTIDFPAPATESGFVVAYEIDARDGGRNSEVKIPVIFGEP